MYKQPLLYWNFEEFKSFSTIANLPNITQNRLKKNKQSILSLIEKNILFGLVSVKSKPVQDSNVPWQSWTICLILAMSDINFDPVNLSDTA